MARALVRTVTLPLRAKRTCTMIQLWRRAASPSRESWLLAFKASSLVQPEFTETVKRLTVPNVHDFTLHAIPYPIMGLSADLRTVGVAGPSAGSPEGRRLTRDGLSVVRRPTYHDLKSERMSYGRVDVYGHAAPRRYHPQTTVITSV